MNKKRSLRRSGSIIQGNLELKKLRIWHSRISSVLVKCCPPMAGWSYLTGRYFSCLWPFWSLLQKAAPNPHVCSLKRSRSIACSLGVNLLEKGSPSWRKMSSLEHLRINHYLPWRTAAPEEGGGQDSTEGGNYFSRRRICGEKFQRLTCCPASSLGYFHNIIHIKGALKSHYI